MYLALIETSSTVEVSAKSPTSAHEDWQDWAAMAPVLEKASLSRLYEATGNAFNRVIWSEFESMPKLTVPAGIKLTILKQTQSIGETGGLKTPWVYLVHTDIAPDLIDEYNAWYGEEHLPRLVKVPGILRARRFTACVGAPRYLTAYDLTDRDAFESPQGLVARKTPWTERMRSQFSNTRRIMCRLIDG